MNLLRYSFLIDFKNVDFRNTILEQKNRISLTEKRPKLKRILEIRFFSKIGFL